MTSCKAVPAPTTPPAAENCECLRVPQVASMLGVSQNHIWRLLRSGKLPGLRIGRVWAIRRSDLTRYLDKLVAEQSPELREAIGLEH